MRAKMSISFLHLHCLQLLVFVFVLLAVFVASIDSWPAPTPVESAAAGNVRNSPVVEVEDEELGDIVLQPDSEANVNAGAEEDEISPGYADALAKARCRARCMVGESIPRLDPVSLFLTSPSICESQRCKECEQCMLGQSEAADCANSHGLPSFCVELYLRDRASDAGTSIWSWTTSSNDNDRFHFSELPSPTPLFHCSQKQPDNVTFNAAFRFEYTHTTKNSTTPTSTNSSSNVQSNDSDNQHGHAEVLADFASWSPDLVPRVFVVRQALAGSGVEYIISDKWLHTAMVPERTRLTLSVTAVSATTIYRPSSPTTIELKDSVHRASGSPKNLRVVDIRLVPAVAPTAGNGSGNGNGRDSNADYHQDEIPLVTDAVLNDMDLEVLLHWQSGSGLDATCIFGTYCLHDEMTKKESKTPEHAFWAVLDKKLMQAHAKFGTRFKVDVVERPEVGREENLSSINVVIPSCLDFLQGDFTKCAPPPVSNLRGQLQFDGFLTLDWDPPSYRPDHGHDPENFTAVHPRSTPNHVQMYKIEVHRLSHMLLVPTTFTLPGNTTHFETQLNLTTVASLTASLPGAAGLGTGTNGGSTANDGSVSESILIIVQAKTLGGTSRPSRLTVRAEAVQASSLVEKLVTTIGLIFALILLVVVFFVIKNSFQKHQRKKSNREYFETLSLNGGEIPRVDDLDGRDGSTALIEDTTILHGYEFTKWEIPANRMTVKEIIGSGAFGVVREGLLFENGRMITVAVKSPKNMNGVSGEIETKKFWEEFEMMKGLGKHVHIVGLIGILASKPYEPPSLVVEYCHGGDLQSHLRNHCKFRPLNYDLTDCNSNTNSNNESTEPVEGVGGVAADAENTSTADGEGVIKKISKPSVFLVTNETYFMKPEENEHNTTYYLSDLDIISYARQIACGMEFLATNKIVHRDLAARNVLVSIEHDICSERGGRLPKRTLKISDFGLSRDVYEQNWYKRNSKGLVPVKWLALECLLQEMYTSKSDVWSFGILLWEIVTLGGSPYPGVDNAEMFERLKKGYRMQQPAYCSDALYELMTNCWAEDPSRRPDFSQLKAELDQMMESSTVLNYLYLDRSGRTSASASESTVTAETLAAEEVDLHSEATVTAPASMNDSDETVSTSVDADADAGPVKVIGNNE